MIVREIQKDDYQAWRVLWDGYLEFYKEELPEEVTLNTWERLFKENSTMQSYVAEDEGAVIGFTHCVIHEATWNSKSICYLEDLFVNDKVRGKGVGQALIQNLLDLAQEKGWSRVYWHTHSDNTAARALYDKFIEANKYVYYGVSIKQ